MEQAEMEERSTSFPASFLYFEKVPWVALCCMLGCQRALLVVPRLGTNPSNDRVQYIFGLGDALSLMACSTCLRSDESEIIY